MTIKDGAVQIKTKTAFIIDALDNDNYDVDYERKPLRELLMRNKQEVSTIILARSGMLERGANFKGVMNEKCRECDVTDNEDHRMNSCIRWRDVNRYGENEKVNFEDIYDNHLGRLDSAVREIEKVRNLNNGGIGMRTAT